MRIEIVDRVGRAARSGLTVDATFRVATDRLTVRIELTDQVNHRRIDIHPAIDDGDGGYWQHGLGADRYATPAVSITRSVIGGRSVRSSA